MTKALNLIISVFQPAPLVEEIEQSVPPLTRAEIAALFADELGYS